jgi:predicted nucleic acid-binding protein
MTPAVLDASAVYDLLVEGPRTAAVRVAFREIDVAIAPALLDAEVLRTVVRHVRQGKLSPARAEWALRMLTIADIERLTLDVLVRHAWSLRHDASPFDSFYVTLARLVGCPLITCDRALAGAPNLGITVMVVQ